MRVNHCKQTKQEKRRNQYFEKHGRASQSTIMKLRKDSIAERLFERKRKFKYARTIFHPSETRVNIILLVNKLGTWTVDPSIPTKL